MAQAVHGQSGHAFGAVGLGRGLGGPGDGADEVDQDSRSISATTARQWRDRSRHPESTPRSLS